MIPYLKSHFRFTLPKVNVADAIKDLPAPIPHSDSGYDWGFSAYPEASELSEYARQMRNPAPKGLGLSDAIKKHAVGEVSGLFSTVHSPMVAERYKKDQSWGNRSRQPFQKTIMERLMPDIKGGDRIG